MDAFVLRYATDTAHPHDIVPIYFIHGIDNPFCPLPDCACHSNQEQIAKLLDYIRQGAMTLREAADFADGRTV
jgi:hypothetical protein